MTFYWPALGRQVRVRGGVVVADANESAADKQSTPVADLAERDRLLDEATERAAADPHLVAPEWTVYRLLADEVEFWQSDERRRHVRLRYTRDAPDGRDWVSELLWP